MRMYTVEGIGKRIRSRREEIGLTRPRLAKVMGDLCCGVNFNTIKDWESERHSCSLEIIPYLCQALDCDTEYLFGNSRTPHKEISSASETTGLSDSAISILNTILKEALGEKKEQHIIALNAIIEKESGRRFLMFLYDYIYAEYLWINMRDSSGEESCRVDDPRFEIEFFDKMAWSAHQYSREELTGLIRDSKMVKIQEYLIKLQEETNESDIKKADRNGKYRQI